MRLHLCKFVYIDVMGNTGKYNDAELFELLKSGDKEAFAEIYQRYWTILFLHSRKILRNDEEAEDVVQELFSNLWLKRESITINISLSVYLYHSARYKVLNIIERRRVVNDYLLSLQNFMKEGELITEELYREKELALLIEKEIQSLPPKMREVFELSRKQHLSYSQIAEQLGITEHTVKSQVSNALRILKLKLNVSAGIVVLLLHHR